MTHEERVKIADDKMRSFAKDADADGLAWLHIPIREFSFEALVGIVTHLATKERNRLTKELTYDATGLCDEIFRHLSNPKAATIYEIADAYNAAYEGCGAYVIEPKQKGESPSLCVPLDTQGTSANQIETSTKRRGTTPVRWFADRMRAKLEEDDPEWEFSAMRDLLEELGKEVEELDDAVFKSQLPADIISEAVSVANRAMMIADNVRARGGE